jgi:hypothetical protein
MSDAALSHAPSAPVLTDDFLTEVDSSLAGADTDLALRYPGDPGTRQPVHTVYLSAADADVDTPQRWGLAALTPQSILGADGTATVAAMIHTAGERCIALHYGTFDYSAALGVAPDQQSLAHPVADHARR